MDCTSLSHRLLLYSHTVSLKSLLRRSLSLRCFCIIILTFSVSSQRLLDAPALTVSPERFSMPTQFHLIFNYQQVCIWFFGWSQIRANGVYFCRNGAVNMLQAFCNILHVCFYDCALFRRQTLFSHRENVTMGWQTLGFQCDGPCIVKTSLCISLLQLGEFLQRED